MKKMKAIRYYAPQDIRYEEVDIQQPGDNEVLVTGLLLLILHRAANAFIALKSSITYAKILTF